MLRSKLGYDGVAVADVAKTAEAMGDAVGTGEAAIQAMAAGCDLMIVEGDAKPVEAVARALCGAIESGALSAERFEQARRRLRSAKKGMARPPGTVSRRELDEWVRRRQEFSRTCARRRGGTGSG